MTMLNLQQTQSQRRTGVSSGLIPHSGRDNRRVQKETRTWCRTMWPEQLTSGRSVSPQLVDMLCHGG